MNSRQLVILTQEYAPFPSREATHATGVVSTLRWLACDVVVIASAYSDDDLDAMGGEESDLGVIFVCYLAKGSNSGGSLRSTSAFYRHSMKSSSPRGDRRKPYTRRGFEQFRTSPLALRRNNPCSEAKRLASYNRIHASSGRDWQIPAVSRPPLCEQVDFGRRSFMIVMMICHYDDTNPMGGLEKQARLLSRGLRSSGYNVVVLASTRQFFRAGWTCDDGVPVRSFWTYTTPQVSGRHLPAALVWAIQILIWIFLNRSKVSVLHCHQIRIHAFIAATASRLWRIPSILRSAVGGTGADIRAIGSRKYFGPVGRRFIIRNTDVFIAITPAIKDDLLLYGVPSIKSA